MTVERNQTLVTIESILGFLPDAPIATTRSRGWPGVTLDLHAREPDYFVEAPARDHHLVAYCVSGRGRLVQRRAGRVHDSNLAAGVTIIAPAEYNSVWEGDAVKSARIRVPVSLISDASQEIGTTGQAAIEIENVFETHDASIEHLAKLVLGEIELGPHPTQILIVEALSCALAAHLLGNYNLSGRSNVPSPQLIGQHTLAKLRSYVEEYIEGPIRLSDLAAVANVSRFQFARTFKRSTGLTPMAFVERLRIERAQELILRTKLPLCEVALAIGFADQSHFTRRFYRHVGSTPGAFARACGVTGGNRVTTLGPEGPSILARRRPLPASGR